MVMPFNYNFYKYAARLLKIAIEENKNVKSMLYTDKKYRYMNIKPLYAVVTEALKHWDVVEILIKDSEIFSEVPKLNIWQVRVFITELIFGEKTLLSECKNIYVKKILQYEDKFKQILSKKATKRLVEKDCKHETEVTKVRYIKVNTIKDDVYSVIERFLDEGWEKLETAGNYEDYLKQLKSLEPGTFVFLQDFHIPEVLVFPPETELHFHQLYINGSFFFMDKASCVAPLLLAPHPEGHVLDMCAAPGLKTIQLASYVTSGKVYAVERDAERCEILQQMVELSCANNVTTIHHDVTKLDCDEYQDVEYVLLDPSCSGSGMTKRQPSANVKPHIDEEMRLQKLSGFQLTLLRFALTRFPAAKRVVYSTCSVNVEENEEVVEAALNSFYHDFDVVSVQQKLPGWLNLGSANFQCGPKCIYFRPEIDCTTGFFVAVFERKTDQLKEKQSDATNINDGKHTYISSIKVEKQTERSKHLKNKKRTNEDFSVCKNTKSTPSYNNEVEPNKDRTVNISNNQTENENHKNTPSVKKLTLSEKKRSRKMRLKKRLLAQLGKNNKIDNTELNLKFKTKIDQASFSNIKKSKDYVVTTKEISKSKLRKKRHHILKTAKLLGSNYCKQNKIKFPAVLGIPTSTEVSNIKRNVSNKNPPSQNTFVNEADTNKITPEKSIERNEVEVPQEKEHKKKYSSDNNKQKVENNNDGGPQKKKYKKKALFG